MGIYLLLLEGTRKESDHLYAGVPAQLKVGGNKITQMEKMIKEGAAFQEPQLLTAVGVPVTVYVGHFVSWPS